jgi:hypothetical protein
LAQGVRMDDIVELRRPHPCGGARWRVVRLGADVGLRCLACQHRVLLPRAVFRRRLKRVLPHGEGDAATDPVGQLTTERDA